ncbi:MAG: 1,4-dihydroxy-2-naphthoate octaprenyltransferase [Spirochaetota bacterium]
MAENNKPSQLLLWLKVMRFFSLSFTGIVGLIGAGFAFMSPGRVNWCLMPVVLAGAFFLHLGANLASEYFDYKKGVDRTGSLGGTGLLVQGYLSPIKVYRAGIGFFIAGVVAGAYVVYRVDWIVLLFGCGGVICGYFYGGRPVSFKYRGLGDVMIFLCFGPLMMLGTYYALVQSFSWKAAAASVPMGMLITAVVVANNIRDISSDVEADITTLASSLGFRAARFEYIFLVAGAYVFTVIMVIFGYFPLSTLAVLLAVAAAGKNIKTMWNAEKIDSPQLAAMDKKTAPLVAQFGLLFFASVMLNALI